jgi:uncharacterized spore protein YtfJ
LNSIRRESMTENREREMDIAIAKPSTTFVEHLAERLAKRASAATVYADPVERDGVTIIPVARVRYGFGGGGGSKPGEEGGGGGGGIQVNPIGYIEVKNGGSEFRPIQTPGATLRSAVTSLLIGSFILSRLYRLIHS